MMPSRQASLLPGSASPWRPLADRMRPRTLAEVVGQTQLLGEGRPLARLGSAGTAHSMIFWGPPGTGKTTLARLVAASCGLRFESLSAVLSGVKEVRQVVETARVERQADGQPTVLFLDEVHRFNKSQQDTFLPFVEDGTLIFIGATTENPSFEVNSALLSRARVYVLKSLSAVEITGLLQRALQDTERGLGGDSWTVEPGVLEFLAEAADGDARRALGLLEIAADLAPADDGAGRRLTLESVQAVAGEGLRRFDKQGEQFYDQISALHKAVRGSDPDAALYWLARMLDGGCDPTYLARRITRMAIEDVGNADPRALALAMDAWQAHERMGSPEADLALAQAVVFMACAAKSNAVYEALSAAREDVRQHGTLEVPLHLRNAPTRLMKDLGYGAGYRYDHAEAGGLAEGQTYFPEALGQRTYYHPAPRGLEIRIAEALQRARAARRGTGLGE
ncbi:MAG: replication-associated recombination protein A [Steroidobacteraceae bacterium]